MGRTGQSPLGRGAKRYLKGVSVRGTTAFHDIVKVVKELPEPERTEYLEGFSRSIRRQIERAL